MQSSCAACYGSCNAFLLQVDVWATGILAYELVVGRPPFEVNDEVQTATMIMFSNNIVYPPKHSALWADFVKVALEKKPHMRPTALQMLDHPWYVLLDRFTCTVACQAFSAFSPLSGHA